MQRNEAISRQSQTQVLLPAVQYSLAVLQMDGIELMNHLRDQEAENPLLEIRTDGFARLPATHADAGEPDQELSPFDRLSHAAGTTLYEHCMDQFDLALPPIDRKLLDTILNCLDQNGFLRVRDEELAALCQVEPALMRAAIAYVQQLDPPGLAARDLPESLCIQLDRQGICDPVLHSIIRSDLESVAAGHYRKLAAKYKIPEEAVRDYVHQIQQLNPRPAAGFGDAATPYVFPELIITMQHGELQCSAAFDYEVTVHPDPIFSAEPDAATLAYLADRRRHANMVKHAVERRRQTMQKLTQYLLLTQADFLRGTGPMIAMQMSQAADALGVSVSTVSRCVAGKYLQFQGGFIPLRRFFSCSVCSTDVSSETMKQVIADVIAAENKCEPLSDQKLMQLLQRRGMRVSRRTVAKYRAELGIPGTHVRRSDAQAEAL